MEVHNWRPYESSLQSGLMELFMLEATTVTFTP